MRKVIYLIVLLISISVSSQNRYLTKTGTVEFEASVPSFEEVKAINKSVTAIINSETGEFAALVLIKGFRFKNALMEEHFNENYAESDLYTKATFKGKIIDFSINSLKAVASSFDVAGELEFHGKAKKLENLEVGVSINDNIITISGEFTADASDYGIKIPKIIRSKISDDIRVSFKFVLKKK